MQFMLVLDLHLSNFETLLKNTRINMEKQRFFLFKNPEPPQRGGKRGVQGIENGRFVTHEISFAQRSCASRKFQTKGGY